MLRKVGFMSQKMKYTEIYINSISRLPNAFASCDCENSSTCEKCEGTGHIFLPFICLAPECEEGFETLEELDQHMKEAHQYPPITRQ
jgi:hypothetical protein